MAVLSTQLREKIWADFMRKLSNERLPIGITKAELRAAFNAADDWREANAASYNSALPQPARGALSTQDKVLLLALVLDAAYGVST